MNHYHIITSETQLADLIKYYERKIDSAKKDIETYQKAILQLKKSDIVNVKDLRISSYDKYSSISKKVKSILEMIQRPMSLNAIVYWIMKKENIRDVTIKRSLSIKVAATLRGCIKNEKLFKRAKSKSQGKEYYYLLQEWYVNGSVKKEFSQPYILPF